MFSSWAMPAARVPSWAIFSLWRSAASVSLRRCITVPSMERAAVGLEVSSCSSSPRPITSSTLGVRARAEAMRGASSSRAISPMTSPALRRARGISRPSE